MVYSIVTIYHKDFLAGGKTMQETKLFYTAAEVAKMLNISVGQAYRLMRDWNKELEQKHFLVIAGRIPVKYFEEKIYGCFSTSEMVTANG